MSKLVETREELRVKQIEIAEIFEEASTGSGDYDLTKADMHGLEGDNARRVEILTAKNEELADLAGKVDKLVEIDNMARDAKAAALGAQAPQGPGDLGDGGGAQPAGPFNLGKAIMESEAYLKRGQRKTAAIPLPGGMKTLFETTAGWEPETIRTGRVQLSPQRQIAVAQLFPQVPTSQAAVVYMEETTFTNAAAETAEGATYPESTLELTEVSSPVRKISTFLPITDEQLDDVDQAAAYVNNRLGFMIRQRLDSQLLVGDGITPNLEGVQTRSGINTQPLGSDTKLDAIHKGITLNATVGFSASDWIVMHPNDWQDIRLTRTSDGIYIMGNPADAGPDMLWGVGVVRTTAETEGTALVGAFAEQSEMSVRKDIEIQISNSHAGFFIEGKQAVRADMRVSLQVYRPQAFTKVTGL